ncbi:hypothetical protein IDSA_06820 [Pseudidiomarina salinarum]|uniref:Type I restriction enzyme R protein N-terminal domain-containing protein n=1 Tax=Pseudidiomarina salinarum TaxID=435908 RepID=A0A094IUI3_9GAMM|nr:hypothetical protein IDSA_06820 [Pseudidiomarina salinarum]
MNAVGNKVFQALTRFLKQDLDLLEIDANERTITHRVAIYLQELFPEMDVDCEYNRDDHDPKEMYLPGGEGDAYDTDAQTVYPDIIVHRRKTGENLLVMEFKKTSSRVDDKKDFMKLHEFKTQLRYQYAIFVEFDVGFSSIGISRVEWVNA